MTIKEFYHQYNELINLNKINKDQYYTAHEWILDNISDKEIKITATLDDTFYTILETVIDDLTESELKEVNMTPEEIVKSEIGNSDYLSFDINNIEFV